MTKLVLPISSWRSADTGSYAIEPSGCTVKLCASRITAIGASESFRNSNWPWILPLYSAMGGTMVCAPAITEVNRAKPSTTHGYHVRGLRVCCFIVFTLISVGVDGQHATGVIAGLCAGSLHLQERRRENAGVVLAVSGNKCYACDLLGAGS